jgi:hypothetical protein
MNKEMLETLVYHLLPPMILIFSFIGNSLGIIVMNRKELLKIGPIRMYQYLFIVNLIISLFILDNYLVYTRGIGFSIITSFTCKLTSFIGYPISPLVPIIMVYIVLERYLSIKYPVESNFLRRNSTQLIYILTIIICNFIIFSYVPFVSNIEFKNNINNNNNTNNISCEIISPKFKAISFIIFGLICVLIPFSLILIFSILLIYKIFNSRTKLKTFYSPRENSLFQKDVKIAFIIISTNCITAVLFAIIIIINFYHITYGTFSKREIIIFSNLFYLHYFGHFYYFLITNSMFRKGFYSLICFKTNKYIDSLN